MTDKKLDDATGVETTGHEWDGIRELNNPLPRWWLYTLYACIAWAIAYSIAYPAWRDDFWRNLRLAGILDTR